VNIVALRQVFFEYFEFTFQFLFLRMLQIPRLPSAAGEVSPLVTKTPGDLVSYHSIPSHAFVIGQNFGRDDNGMPRMFYTTSQLRDTAVAQIV
jgi:hypothetical protein